MYCPWLETRNLFCGIWGYKPILSPEFLFREFPVSWQNYVIFSAF